MSLYAKPSPSPRHECSQPRRCPALGDTRGFSSSSKQHEERMFLRVQTINNPKGGVGGPAGPSTSDRKSATCAAIFARFRQKSLPYTNERPGERLAVRPVSECIPSTKYLWYFVDTLKAAAAAFFDVPTALAIASAPAPAGTTPRREAPATAPAPPG